jgi:hypothetical protein
LSQSVGRTSAGPGTEAVSASGCEGAKAVGRGSEPQRQISLSHKQLMKAESGKIAPVQAKRATGSNQRES